MVLRLLLLLSLVVSSLCSPCTQKCDQNGGSSTTRFLICGTDNATHWLVGDDSVSCYRSCNVSLLNSGPCSCPNYCYQHLSRGSCLDPSSSSSSSSCQCWPEWSGADCSLPSPLNQCGSRGSLVESSFSRLPFCSCRSGYSGAHCQHWPIIPDILNQVPDPVFNLSRVASIRIYVPTPSLITLLTPSTPKGTWITGANISIVLQDTEWGCSHSDKCKVRIGGSYSFGLAKKGFLLHGLDIGLGHLAAKKIKTKPGVNDASYMNSLLATDAYRWMGVSVPLVSMAQIWLNEAYAGLSMMYEESEERFVRRSFPDIPKDGATLYSCDAGLDWRGNDVSQYQNKGYTQELGNGDWSDLLQLISSLHYGNLSAIEQLLDIDQFLRLQAVESVFADGDGFSCSGHNYWLVRNNIHDDVRFTMVRHDLDDSFGLKHNQSPCNTSALSYWAPLNLMTQWGNTVCSHPLTHLVMREQHYRMTYVSYCAQLLKSLVTKSFMNGGANESPLWRRIQTWYDAMSSYLQQDMQYAVDLFSCGGLDKWYTYQNDQFKNYIQLRYETFMNQTTQ